MNQHLKHWTRLSACLILLPGSAAAADFEDYKTSAGTTAVVDLPTAEGATPGDGPSWFTTTDSFPSGTTEMIDGTFEAEGRFIAATGKNIYLQRTYGSGQWDLVGTVTNTMDPSFIHVSPDGNKIALGMGYGAPLLIIPISVLSANNPQVLDTSSSVKSFDVTSYDGDWVDNQYFVINGGQWPGPECTYPYHDDPDCTFQSGVGSVDTESTDPEHTGILLISGIPGASSDVDVDSNGNLITGLGWATGPPNRTGEVKVWATADWAADTPQNLDYESNTRIIGQNMLSSGYLGEDAEGNLHVGGGDAFGVGGAVENGYAAMIKAGIVNDIATGARTTPVNDGNKVDNDEYKFFAPDPCQDDSATGVLSDTWGRGLAVMWNPSGDEAGGCAGTPGSASDYWLTGVTPRLTIYYPGSAPDGDGDGIADSADNAYLTYNPGQEDTDGDGYGNAADADLDNDGVVGVTDFSAFRNAYGTSDPNADLDGDGTVGVTDFSELRSRYSENAPYY